MNTHKGVWVLVGALALGLVGCQAATPASTVTTPAPTIPSPSTSEPPSMNTTPNVLPPQPDSTPGIYGLGSRLGIFITKGDRIVALERVGNDAGGWYAVLSGVKIYKGESCHFEGLGTITVMSVMPGDPLPSGQVGGAGDSATVLYQPD